MRGICESLIFRDRWSGGNTAAAVDDFARIDWTNELHGPTQLCWYYSTSRRTMKFESNLLNS